MAWDMLPHMASSDLDGILLRMGEHETRTVMGQTVKKLGMDVYLVGGRNGKPYTRAGAVHALRTFGRSPQHRTPAVPPTVIVQAPPPPAPVHHHHRHKPQPQVIVEQVRAPVHHRRPKPQVIVERVQAPVHHHRPKPQVIVEQVRGPVHHRQHPRVEVVRVTGANFRGGRRYGNQEDFEEEDDFDLHGEMREGIVIHDARGGGYSVSSQDRYYASSKTFDGALKLAAEKMEKDQYWPNVFHVNDHGNVALLALKPKIVKGRVVKVTSKQVRDWV